MLHTRSLLPLVSHSSQQWQLHSLLRLPPELRLLAVRSFSSASSLQTEDDMRSPHAKGHGSHGNDDGHGPRIMRRKSGAGWGQNPHVDAMVRKMNALDPVKDAEARDALAKQITAHSSKATAHALRLIQRDNEHKLHASHRAQVHAESMPFEPFSDGDSLDKGFGFYSRSSLAIPPTKTNVEDVSRTRSGSRQHEALAKQSQALESNARKDVLGSYLTDEEARKWLSSSEFERWQELTAEFKDAPGRRSRLIRNRLRNLRSYAEKRRQFGTREADLELKVANELRLNPDQALIVRPNGTVETKGESARKLELQKLIRERDTSEAQRMACRNELSVLDRKARTRGDIIGRRAEDASKDELSIRVRLAQLKEKLLQSPKTVADAPQIQSQLNVLENALRTSLKSVLPDAAASQSSKASALGLMLEGSKGKKLQNAEIKARESPLLLPSNQSSLQPGNDQEGEKEHVTHPTPASEQESKSQSQDFVARMGDVSVFAELRAQIQELTSVVKMLVSQQAAAQLAPTTANTLSQIVEKANATIGTASPSVWDDVRGTSVPGRYRSLSSNDIARDQEGRTGFSELPHELDDRKDAAESDNVQSDALEAPSPVPSTVNLDQAAVDSASGLDELGSLYEQLFPEEAKQSAQADASKVTPPRLELPRDVKPGEFAPMSPPSSEAPVLNDRPIRTVLVLRSASKTLTEDDFRRAMPRGKHIQEWTQRGEYDRVIPMRDFWTLERTGDYYIIFKHHKVADAFLSHVKRVFEMTRQHTPTSLLSDLPPAPSRVLGDGYEDEADLVRNFTLATPSMTLQLDRLSQGIKAEVLQKGGYPQALPGTLTPETPQVLLEFDGGVMPNWFQLRDAISRDGLRRELPWVLIPGELAIRKLAMAPSQRDKDADYEASLGSEANELVASESLALGNGGFGDDFAMLAQDRMRNGANGQRWVVAFREREEAQRFSRSWHMRGFPWTEAENKKDKIYKGTTRVKAEVLW